MLILHNENSKRKFKTSFKFYPSKKCAYFDNLFRKNFFSYVRLNMYLLSRDFQRDSILVYRLSIYMVIKSEEKLIKKKKSRFCIWRA